MGAFPRLTCRWLLLGLLVCPFASVSGFAQDAVPALPSHEAIPKPIIDPGGAYHVGNGVTPPRLISSVDAEFSELARRKKLSGRTTLALVVGTDGIPKDIRVKQSLAEGKKSKLQAAARSLDEKAIEAVSQYRFSPATYQDKPVPTAITVEVNFRIY